MTPSPRRPFVRLVLASALVAGLWGCERDPVASEPVATSAVVATPEGVDEVVTMLVHEAMRSSTPERSDGADKAGPVSPTRHADDVR